MYFTNITLTNVFSYYGSKYFEFGTPSSKRNVVLLKGRNGQGKTSFLNALHLLFLSENNELLRRRAAGRKIAPVRFLYGEQGDNPNWWGVLNHKARQHARNNNLKAQCSVAVTLFSQEQGGTVTITRSWEFSASGDDYTTNTQFYSPFKNHLTDDAAEQAIAELIPPDFLPFYFFDGEDIQQLANSNSSQTIKHIEKILNVSAVEYLNQQAGLFRKRLQRNQSSSELQKKLQELEFKINQHKLDIQTREEKIANHSHEKEDFERQLENKNQQHRILRGIPSGSNESAIKEKIETLQNQRSDSLKNIADMLLTDTILFTAPQLITKSIDMADTQISTDHAVVDDIKKALHQAISNSPQSSPPLSEPQIKFYKRKLSKALEPFKMGHEHDAAFNVNSHNARELIKQLSPYLNQERLAGFKQTLEQITANTQQLNEQQKSLRNTSELAEEEQKEFEQLNNDIEFFEHHLKLAKDEIYQYQREIKAHQTQIKSLEGEIKTLEQQIKFSDKDKRHAELARQIETTCWQFVSYLKQTKQPELESAINKYLKPLLDSNQLIHKVKVSESFAISYWNQQNEQVPMSSLSAGTLQMLVTAITWALKDISGRKLPLVIDTPLARIDRRHQENLLKHYYPNAAEQVIVLPTDSELDGNKHNLIKPHVYCEYQLHNPTGDDTQIQRSNIPEDTQEQEG